MLTWQSLIAPILTFATLLLIPVLIAGLEVGWALSNRYNRKTAKIISKLIAVIYAMIGFYGVFYIMGAVIQAAYLPH
jgi:TctA family transporter